MEKTALRCDVCNGSLTMQPGGELAICDYCGTKYALPRLREKIQEIRGTVSVAGVVKTTSADFDIQAGVLLHYRGIDTEVVIPDDVREIGSQCFSGMHYLTSVTFPKGLKRIADRAFANCTGLTQITFPEGLVSIGESAFERCYGLTHITFPQKTPEFEGRFSGPFADCCNLRVVNPKKDYWGIIRGFWSVPPSPWLKSYFMRHGKCLYCGGEFEGLFWKQCRDCGQRKNY